MEEFLQIDEESEAINAIEMVAFFSNSVSEDPYYWKWLIIALHNALQNFMVLTLFSINPIPILRNDHSKKFIKNHYETKKIKNYNYKLDTLEDLYLKIKNEAKEYNLSTNYFKPKDTDDWSVKTLNQYRNEFMHFIPCDISRSIINMICITTDSIRIIKYLFLESNRIKLNKTNFARVKIAINTVIENNNLLIDSYNLEIRKLKFIPDDITKVSRSGTQSVPHLKVGHFYIVNH